MPMPDSSGESSPASHQPPDAPRPAGEPEHLAPAPRLHPPSTRQPKETAAPPPPPALEEVLAWMQRYGTAGIEPDDQPAEAGPSRRSSRAQLPKEQRKFHKFDPEHPEPELPVTGGPKLPRIRDPFGPGKTEETRSAFADYPGSITSEQIEFIRRLRQEAPGRSPWIALGVAVVFFLLVTGAFLAGHGNWTRFSSGTPIVPGGAEKIVGVNVAFRGLSDSVVELIDQAVQAEKAKDYSKAIERLERAQREAGHVYGLNYRLAGLRYKANDVARVLPLLDQSIADGEEVAACYRFRGRLSGQTDRTDHGPGDLEKATQSDPFDPRYPLAWGEALRRAGKVEQALDQFRRAADRAQEIALQDAYALKVRLTQIELGRQDEFAADMARELQLNPPPVEWLFTAAAVEMHRNNLPAAAENLIKIRGLIGATATALQLQDAFFTGYAHDPELAGFYEILTPADPASGSTAP